jgi:predicted tellurium resistance membrane protein TerC
MLEYNRYKKKHIYKHVKTPKSKQFLKAAIGVFFGTALVMLWNPFTVSFGVPLILTSLIYGASDKIKLFSNKNGKDKKFKKIKIKSVKFIKKQKSKNKFYNKIKQQQENNTVFIKKQTENFEQKHNITPEFVKEMEEFLIKQKKTPNWQEKMARKEEIVKQKSEELLKE